MDSVVLKEPSLIPQPPEGYGLGSEMLEQLSKSHRLFIPEVPVDKGMPSSLGHTAILRVHSALPTGLPYQPARESLPRTAPI